MTAARIESRASSVDIADSCSGSLDSMEMRVTDNPDEQRYEVVRRRRPARRLRRLPRWAGADLVHPHRGRRRSSRARASARRSSAGRSTTPARAGSRCYPSARSSTPTSTPPRVRWTSSPRPSARASGSEPRRPDGSTHGGAAAGGLVAGVTASAHPRRFRRLPTAEVASRRVPVAVTLLSRLLGLALLRPGRAGEGLLIPRCRSVHTFGMRFAIDLVFLDRERRPIAVAPRGPPEPRRRRAPAPRRCSSCRRAARRAGVMLPQRRARADGGRLRRRRADARAALRPPRRPTASTPCRRRRAADALRLCHYNQPDLLLLDLNLPDASGLEVLREIRASEGATGSFDPELPVIVLSGRGSDADRLRGLDCGADDYVVKPFAIQEVVARMRAVLRRRDGRRAGPLRVGELVVDPSRREVRVGGEPVQLANKEFSLLRTLATEPTPGLHQGRAAARRLGLSLARAGPGRSTRTRAGCGASSTPSPAATCVNCWGVGYRLIDAPEDDDARLDR